MTLAQPLEDMTSIMITQPLIHIAFNRSLFRKNIFLSHPLRYRSIMSLSRAVLHQKLIPTQIFQNSLQKGCTVPQLNIRFFRSHLSLLGTKYTPQTTGKIRNTRNFVSQIIFKFILAQPYRIDTAVYFPGSFKTADSTIPSLIR